MYIDAQNLFCENKSIAAAVSPATTSETVSDVIDLGNTGGFIHPLYIDVKLTTPFSAGKITKITVQSSASDSDFSSAVDEIAVVPPSTQTKAMTLAQFFAMIKPQNRFIRLKFDAGSSPVGGKVTASMVNGVRVEM